MEIYWLVFPFFARSGFLRKSTDLFWEIRNHYSPSDVDVVVAVEIDDSIWASKTKPKEHHSHSESQSKSPFSRGLSYPWNFYRSRKPRAKKHNSRFLSYSISCIDCKELRVREWNTFSCSREATFPIQSNFKCKKLSGVLFFAALVL